MYYIHVLGNFSSDPEDDFATFHYSHRMDYEEALDEIMDKGFKIVQHGGSSVYVQPPEEEEEDEGFEDYE